MTKRQFGKNVEMLIARYAIGKYFPDAEGIAGVAEIEINKDNMKDIFQEAINWVDDTLNQFRVMLKNPQYTQEEEEKLAAALLEGMDKKHAEIESGLSRDNNIEVNLDKYFP